MRIVLALVGAGLLGCVQTTYTRTVEVQFDADGREIGRTVIESATQPGQGWPLQMEYLKGTQPGN